MNTYGIRSRLVALLFAAAHCGDDGGPQAGQATAACVDGMCFSGLECLSNLCVDPDGTSTSPPDDPTTGAPEGDVGPGLPCNPYTQDCIAGFKCHPQEDVSDVCVKLEDTLAEVGEPCTPSKAGGLDSDTCVEGAYCDRVATGEFTCLAMCKPPVESPTCPTADTICHAYMGGKAPVCRPRCDPLDVTCGGNQLCIPSLLENGFFCFSPYNKFDFGEVCYGGINSCLVGLMCVPDEAFAEGVCIGGGMGCCSYVCDLTAPACPGQVPNCVPWWPVDSTPPGDEHIGYCSV